MKRIKYISLLFTALFFIHDVFAQNRVDSLLNELSKAPDDTNKVNLLKDIGGAVVNQDARKAIAYWQQAVNLSRKLNYTIGLSRCFINIGVGYSYIAMYDSTSIYYDSAIVYCKALNNPERLALVYLNKGDVYRALEDYNAALVYCDTARMYAEKTTNTDRQARIYTITSNIYSEQRQFAKSTIFLDKAIALYRKDKNNIMVGQSYDDYGLLYQKMGQLDSSLMFRKMAVSIGESEQDDKNLSTYYYGVADIYTDQHKYQDAIQYVGKSLSYAKQQDNNSQMVSAYSLLCKIYIKQKRFDEAIRTGDTAWKLSKDELQLAVQQESAALLAEAYTGSGDYKNANHFLTISSSLKDSLTKRLFNGQVAKLESAFELKEKNKEILLLGKDKEIQQQRLFRQRVFFGIAVSLFLIALLAISMLTNRNRLRQRMKELELRNQIAADLHDEVGSSLSSIHMLSQMANEQSNDSTQKNILTRMSSNAKETMEKMGDIVWMIKPGETEENSLKQRMERFAYEICSARNIEIKMELTDLDKCRLSMEQRKNIYLIFKEALNNAVKYSGTDKIEVITSVQNKELLLQVKDFGNGFESDLIKWGNGLSNMQNRAKELNGKIEIKSTISKGTELRLVIFNL